MATSPSCVRRVGVGLFQYFNQCLYYRLLYPDTSRLNTTCAFHMRRIEHDKDYSFSRYLVIRLLTRGCLTPLNVRSRHQTCTSLRTIETLVIEGIQCILVELLKSSSWCHGRANNSVCKQLNRGVKMCPY